MWRAILAAAALLFVFAKKKLIPWCKKHLLPKRMRLLREVTDWNSEHLCYQQKDGIPMRCYRSDSGNAFALGSRADEIYALAARAAMDTKSDKERIEAAVRGMQTAVAQTRDDLAFPMPAEQPQAAEQDAAQPEEAETGMRMQ